MIKNIIDEIFVKPENKDIQSDHDILSAAPLKAPKGWERLVHLYISEFDSRFCIFSPAKRYSCVKFLGGHLLIYKYITIEQFRSLLPDYNAYRISNIINRFNNRKKQFFASRKFDDNQVYYYLTPAGFEYFSSFVPEEFLYAAMIPLSKKDLPSSSMAAHEVKLRDVPCGCLSIECFSKFDWYSSIPLYSGYSPVESISAYRSTISLSTNIIIEKNTLVADGIILFRDDAGSSSVIVEQDTGSERGKIMLSKLSSYYGYLNSLKHPEKTCLLFNIYVPSKDSTAYKNENPSEKKNLFITTPRNIDLLLNTTESIDLNVFYSNICSYIEAGKQRSRTYKNIKRLLDMYVKEGNDLSAGIDPLRDYISRKKAEISNLPYSPSVQNRSRYNYLRNIILISLGLKNNDQKSLTYYNEVLSSEESLLSAVTKGASILITNNFMQHAYYLFPYESGFLNAIISKLSSKYCSGYDMMKARSSKNLISGFIFKNVVRIINKGTGEESFFIVQEISSDVSAFYNTYVFLKNYTGRNIDLHLILLVSSIYDAITLERNTGFINRFCEHDDIMRPNPVYRLTIRFFDYGSCKPGNSKLVFFLPSSYGRIVTNEL